MLCNISSQFNCVAVIGFFCITLQVGVYATALNEEEKNCVEKLKLNRSIIEAWNIEPLLPEDNEEISKYMSCYWKSLGYQKEDGEFNYLKISEVVHGDLKNRFRSNCLHITAYVVNNCRTNVKADSDGLRAIRMWNCLNINTENLF